MKTKITFVVGCLFALQATSSLAATNTFNCAPTAAKPNGLNVKSVKLEMDTENPDADVTIHYIGKSSASIIHADTEGDDVNGYKITWKGGHASFSIKNMSMNLLSDTVDTFSSLSCIERLQNPPGGGQD